MTQQSQRRLSAAQNTISRVRENVSNSDLTAIISATQTELHSALGDIRIDGTQAENTFEQNRAHLDRMVSTIEQSGIALPQTIAQKQTRLNLIATNPVGAERQNLMNMIASVNQSISTAPANQNNQNLYNQLNTHNTRLSQMNTEEAQLTQEIATLTAAQARATANITPMTALRNSFDELQTITRAIDTISPIAQMTFDRGGQQRILLHNEFIGQGRTLPNASSRFVVYDQQGNAVRRTGNTNVLQGFDAVDANGQIVRISGVSINAAGVVDLQGITLPQGTRYPITISFDVGIRAEYNQQSFAHHPVALSARKRVTLEIRDTQLQSGTPQNAPNNSQRNAINTELPRINAALQNVHTQHCLTALRTHIATLVQNYGGNTLTPEQRDAIVSRLISLHTARFSVADFQARFLDTTVDRTAHGLLDPQFRGSEAAFVNRIREYLSAATADNIYTKGQAALDAWISSTLLQDAAFMNAIQQQSHNAITATNAPVTNLLTTTTGPLTTNLLTTYAANRGNYFPIQDEVSRRYRGMPIIRNFRRRRDDRFRDGPDVRQERVDTVAQNSYMTFFEQLDTSATPEKIEKVALPSGLGEVDVSAAIQYHPGQNSLAQNGTVTISVAGTQVNVGPITSISNGYGLHGIIETILRQNFHSDGAVNNVITTNAIIAVYKTLVRTAQGKFGVLRVGTQSITLNNKGNLVFTDSAAPATNCSEQTLRDSNDYAAFAARLPDFARGFHTIMSAKNTEYIAGVTGMPVMTPGIRNPLSRMRYRRLLAQPVEFTAGGVTGTYDRAGAMHLTFQTPEGEEMTLDGSMEEVFSSPLLYGRQHEILEAYYRAFALRAMTSRRANRSAGFYCVHDGRTYAVINRGTPAAPHLVYGEIPTIPGGHPFGGAGRLPANMVNTITPTNERTMLSNPQLMNNIMSVMAAGV